MEKQMVQTKCQEVEQQIKDDLQYVGEHSGEWILEQLSLLFFSKTDLGGTAGTNSKSLFPIWLRRLWKLIRPLAYYWLGDVGWHLFKLWFIRLFKKKAKGAKSSKNAVD